MTPTEAVDVVVKVMAPYIGDTMARSATEAHRLAPFQVFRNETLFPSVADIYCVLAFVAGGAHRQLQLLRS